MRILSVLLDMARYNVTPSGTGGTRWKVEKNGTPLSQHNTQSNAISRARRDASSGDTLVIHNSKGQIRDTRTVR